MNCPLIRPLKTANSVHSGPTGPPGVGPGSWVHGQDPGPGLKDPGPGIPTFGHSGPPIASEKNLQISILIGAGGPPGAI